MSEFSRDREDCRCFEDLCSKKWMVKSRVSKGKMSASAQVSGDGNNARVAIMTENGRTSLYQGDVRLFNG